MDISTVKAFVLVVNTLTNALTNFKKRDKLKLTLAKPYGKTVS